MSDLPAPMTPPDCDLRGMPYMPLDIVRLFDSDLYALSTGDEFKAALTLWGKAFLQRPGGSLPDDERILAHLSGAGTRWKSVREMALRGWIKCSDGRLYHPTVAEKAKEAWDSRLARRARTEAARAARHGAKAASDTGSAPPVASSVTENVAEQDAESVTTSVTENVTGSKGTEQNGTEEVRKKDIPSSLRSDGAAQPSEPPPADPPAKPKRAQQVPPDWRPSDADRNFAACHIAPGDLDQQVEQFRDHHRAKGNTFRDLSAAWRTWCRNHSRWKAQRTAAPAPRQSNMAWMLPPEPDDASPIIDQQGVTLQ